MTRTRNKVLYVLFMLAATAIYSGCGFEGGDSLALDPEAEGIMAMADSVDDVGIDWNKYKRNEFGIITHQNPVPDSYIVQFKDDMVVGGDQSLILTPDLARSMADMVVEENQLATVRIGHVFQAGIKGFTAKMSAEEAAALAQDPRVLIVEQDAYVHASTVQSSAPWHLDRIDQQNLPLTTKFAYPTSSQAVHIYVLDLGARCTHSQFSGKILTGYTNSPDIQGGNSGGCVAGTPVTNSGISVAAGANAVFSPTSITGNAIVVNISASTGDADLYVRKGSAPTTTTYDCRPYTSSSTEVCDMTSFGAGTYYIMVRAYNAVTGLTITRKDNCASQTSGTYGDACAAGKHGHHGTHTMGIAGGTINGVAQGTNFNLHSVRTMPNDGYGLLSDQVAGFTWVTANKVAPAVINFSIGEDGVYATEDNAIQAAVNAGIFVAVAAGNANEDTALTSPGSSTAAFVVAASNINDAFANYSNWGAAVDIIAPGGDGAAGIVSTTNTSDTATTSDNGTSMASPVVAGVAAQIRAANPSWTVAQVKTEILAKALTGKITGVPTGTVNKFLQSLTTCGDGYCNGAETNASCPSECAPVCGNGTCDNGETCSSCSADCGMCGCDVGSLSQTNLSGGALTRCFTNNNPTITIAGPNGDADLYVKKGSAPTTASYDCRSNGSSSNESCVMSQGNGVYYILINPYSAFSGLSLSTSVCIANCAGKQCGSDGCGGQCGTCESPLVCDSYDQCAASSSVCDTFAYTITAGTNYASMTDPDTKKYSVKLVGGTQYTFSTCVTYTGDPYIRLAQGTTSLVVDDDGCGTNASKIIYTPSANGTFDVYLGCYYNNTCTATLKITPPPDCPTSTNGSSFTQ